MIKASDLRIGNRLLLDGRIMIVTEIWDRKITLVEDYEPQNVLDVPGEEWVKYECNELTSIPLTEEWLLKFGFEEDGDGFHILEIGRKAFCISTSEDNHIVYRHDIGLSSNPVNPGLDYVHQLQNLYYAIIGEELEVRKKN